MVHKWVYFEKVGEIHKPRGQLSMVGWSNEHIFTQYTCSQKFAHTCCSLLHKHPWQSELLAWPGRAKLFQSWGPFWKICTSLYANFRKKNLIRYVLWKVSNFALIFYVCVFSKSVQDVDGGGPGVKTPKILFMLFTFMKSP